MFTHEMIDEMLHYLKAGESIVAYKDIKAFLDDSNELCPFMHGEEVDSGCYLTNPAMKDLFFYLERYILCFEFLEINIYFLENLQDMVFKVKNPVWNRTQEMFKGNLKDILDIIKHFSDEIKSKLKRLTCEECVRLDEALTTFSHKAFRSCVIMAVSAVEARLHYLIKNRNKRIYNKYFEKATLGQIIQLFDEKQYKDRKFNSIKKMLPKKHKPLMELLNYYRIFSAHPKTVNGIDFKTAQSILNLSFNFLLDEEIQIKDKRLLKCK